ncbi:hypothetical protein FA95DRAFT_827268 [Auriscalpium vulgare]|uniref:Uncharacterized protein n=1 Tax=Auriscalpium vulgare TaxID=40419 RepID=A0ACB8RAS2_9AGAM|nr:hypothetical protein FA95DRAFT_827268 [Auriscalpium vulgare]
MVRSLGIRPFLCVRRHAACGYHFHAIGAVDNARCGANRLRSARSMASCSQLAAFWGREHGRRQRCAVAALLGHRGARKRRGRGVVGSERPGRAHVSLNGNVTRKGLRAAGYSADSARSAGKSVTVGSWVWMCPAHESGPCVHKSNPLSGSKGTHSGSISLDLFRAVSGTPPRQRSPSA